MRLPLEGTTRWAGVGFGALLLAALLAVGLALPRFLIGDGLESYRDDPVRREVAARAYQGAWLLSTGSWMRHLLPVARVVEVAYEPGNCASDGPGAGREQAAFTARVRFYTLFGVPGPSVRATCGGWSRAWSRQARGGQRPRDGAPPT